MSKKVIKQNSNNIEAVKKALRRSVEERVQRAFERDIIREVMHPGQQSLDSELFPLFKNEVQS